ncbi:MAG: hypothetical protein J2P22_08140 [Nocardioides sp.]|nr:hypothetical protein [Nocardioides sp.]
MRQVHRAPLRDGRESVVSMLTKRWVITGLVVVIAAVVIILLVVYGGGASGGGGGGGY